jgi:NitT/TauT family transport system ATP-binding protein
MRATRSDRQGPGAPAAKDSNATGADPVSGEVILEVRGLRHGYGPASAPPVLDGLSFTVNQAELVCVVGPSGCGKTTLIRCITGLRPTEPGMILLDGVAVKGVPEDTAVVFQDYGRSLFPWLRVAANVDFPLSRRGLDRSERRQRVRQSLAAVGLEHVGDRYPWQLSGGMQQRVAIARALAYGPRIMLLDEPFASVDAQTRAELEDLILAVRADFGVTILLVTHDIDESVYLADRVLVLSRSPAKLLAEIPVDLPHPRDQIATKELDAFVHLRGEVGRLVRRAAGGGQAPGGGPAAGAGAPDAAEPAS